MGCLDTITNLIDMSLSKLWEIVEDTGVWHVAVHGVTESDTSCPDLAIEQQQKAPF